MGGNVAHEFLPLPSGLIGRVGKPALLPHKARPFVPFMSYRQFFVALMIFAAVVTVLAVFGSGGAVYGGIVGAAVGIAPSIIATAPYEMRLETPRPAPWLDFTRAYLALSRLARNDSGRGEEIWGPTASWWRVWPNTTFEIFVEPEGLRVTGPRGLIFPLQRNWNRIVEKGSALV